MVLVEDAARLGDVDRLLLGQSPRAARPASRGRCGPCRFRRALPTCAPAGAAPSAPPPPPPAAYRPSRSLRPVVRSSCGAAIALTQLPLDGRHLLAQQDLALPLVETGAGLAADLGGQPQHLAAVAPVRARRVRAGPAARSSPGSPASHPAGCRDRRRPGRPVLAGLIERLDGVGQPLRRLRQQLQRLEAAWRRRCEHARLDLGRLRLRLLDPMGAGDEEGPLVDPVEHAETLHPLATISWCEPSGAVIQRRMFATVPVRMQVGRPRDRRLRPRAASQCRWGAPPCTASRDGRDRLRPADAERARKPGEDHRVSHRQDDDDVRRQGNRG